MRNNSEGATSPTQVAQDASGRYRIVCRLPGKFNEFSRWVPEDVVMANLICLLYHTPTPSGETFSSPFFFMVLYYRSVSFCFIWSLRRNRSMSASISYVRYGSTGKGKANL